MLGFSRTLTNRIRFVFTNIFRAWPELRRLDPVNSFSLLVSTREACSVTSVFKSPLSVVQQNMRNYSDIKSTITSLPKQLGTSAFASQLPIQSGRDTIRFKDKIQSGKDSHGYQDRSARVLHGSLNASDSAATSEGRDAFRDVTCL